MISLTLICFLIHVDLFLDLKELFYGEGLITLSLVFADKTAMKIIKIISHQPSPLYFLFLFTFLIRILRTKVIFFLKTKQDPFTKSQFNRFTRFIFTQEVRNEL